MMQVTQYTIYWTADNEPRSKRTHDMGHALKWMEYLRRDPKFSAICFASENADQVGRMGVDSIVDGKTPDGHKYTWVKRRVGEQQ